MSITLRSQARPKGKAIAIGLAAGTAFAIGLAFALISVAKAADKGGPAPQKVAQAAPSYTGCWLGGHGGIAVMDTKVDLNNPPPGSTGQYLSLDGLSGSGTLVGLRAGCDLQLPNSRLVVGAFGDYNWFQNTEFVISTPALGGASGTMALDRQWTVGGRVGYLVTPATLIYALGAYSVLEMDALSATVGGVPVGSLALPTFKGFEIGGGVEMHVAEQVRVSLEYRQGFYEAESVTAVPGVLALDIDPTVHTVRTSVTYKLGSFGQ